MFIQEISGCNIFTDASIISRTIGNPPISYYVAVPGANYYMPFSPRELITQNSIKTILHYCTNNQAELTAIHYGINLGYQVALPNQTINIFSDSKISIFGLREWIFNWIKNERDGILLGSSGPVANQSYYIAIICTIITNNRPVRFYHIRGHKNINSFSDRKKFENSFLKENHIDGRLSETLIDYCISGNDIIDRDTRLLLTPENIERTAPTFVENYYDPPRELFRIFNYHDFIQSLDMDKYKYLIGGK